MSSPETSRASTRRFPKRSSRISSAVYQKRNPPDALARLPWRAILSNGNVLVVSFSYFTYGYAASIFFTWFFIYLNTVRKLDARHSSYDAMLPLLAMAVGSPLGGWVGDILVKRSGMRGGRFYTACVAMAICAVFMQPAAW